jgi:hypothetical protein
MPNVFNVGILSNAEFGREWIILEQLVGGTIIRADAFVVGTPEMPGEGSEFLRSLTTRWFDEFARFCDNQNSLLL